MLFHIDEKDLTILNPECVKLCPELGPLLKDEERLQYIILVYDYDSIYKQWPEPDRKRKAIDRIWNGKTPKNIGDSVMERAIDAYKSLQYNSKVELMRTYLKKVDEMQQKIEGEDDDKMLERFAKIITNFRKYARDLEMEISIEKMDDGRIQGDQKKSWIEKWQSNKDEYAAVIKKKEKDVPAPPLS